MEYEALLSLMRFARNYEKSKSKDFKLNHSESLICTYLSTRESVTQDTIARAQIMDKTTVAKSLKLLEEKGYIHRHANPANRRENLIFLAEEGKADVRKIQETQEYWLRSICQGIGEEKLKVFFDVIGDMLIQAKKLDQEEAAK